MGVFDLLSGRLLVEVTSASASDMLSSAAECGITFRSVILVEELKIRVWISRIHFKKFEKFLKRRGEDVRIIRRTGLYWSGKGLLRRPVLLVGVAVLASLALFLPTRVLFVQIEGNITVPERLILDSAKSCGIRFGASREAIRSEQVKNALLADIPQLKWLGVNTYGCVAVISVEEAQSPEESGDKHQVSSIVAQCDGIIRKITATQGNVLCKVGQAVRKDQLLVSGYTDCGTIIKSTQAEAEIYADTLHQITSISPINYASREGVVRSETYYSVRFGKNIINLCKDSGISDTRCVKMYKEKYITLPGGFELPIAIITEAVIWLDAPTSNDSADKDFVWLEEATRSYLLHQMNAGRILNEEIQGTVQDELFVLQGKYICLEMIAKIRQEESLEIYGKRN